MAVSGTCSGIPEEIPGKLRENCWKMLPESRNAINSMISGTRKSKPAANLGSTLPGPCPHLPPAFSSFYECRNHVPGEE